ncbi:MAG: FAD-dependent oxidoreductase [Acidimicrobiales bacterium]
MGAGIVGAAIAARLATAGVEVCLLDRSGPAAGASSSGEGNILVSDKLPGPELSLAVRSLALWRELASRGGEQFEFEAKGGLVVARDRAELEGLQALALSQRQSGVSAEVLAGDDLRDVEPALSPHLTGGVYYEADCQVQPMLAVAFHVADAVAHGACAVAGAEVVSADHAPGGAIRALRTTKGAIGVGRWAVNAAGPWAGELARRLGAGVAVLPRRGHVLVTEPLPPLVRHKVYGAGYVGSVHASGPRWTCSPVVEATKSGTVLIGSSRELAGFSGQLDAEIVAELAARATALFPGLGGARLMRAYVGFRPATPDRLPIIGPDPGVGALLHATGHEGAGIGLAEVTAELVEALVVGAPPPVDLAPFAPGRFEDAAEAPAEGTAEVAAEGPAEVAVGPAPRPEPVAAGAGRPPRLAPRGGRGLHGRPRPAPSPTRVHFRFDGRDFTAPAGSTVAGALLANGQYSWGLTRSGAQPRGLFCGIGTCFDCLVDLNGARAVRACLAPLHDNDEVRTSGRVGGTCPVPGRAPAPGDFATERDHG